jgi:AcrR family transcriptional regulator
VLRAAGDALTEKGVDGLDLADVARRAEVGKTTVYRRWSTPAGLIADLLADMAARPVRPSDTGSLAGDLRAHARGVVAALTDPREGPLLRAVVAAATCHAQTARALRLYHDSRVDAWAECVRAAERRGEAPMGTDPHEVVRAVAAPLFHQVLVACGPLDQAAGERAAAAALAAVRAGAFVRS